MYRIPRFFNKQSNIVVDLPLKKLNYELAIWLNFYDWILRTNIKDLSINEVFVTSKNNELKL